MKYTSIETKLSNALCDVLNSLYGVSESSVSVAPTRKEFEGDYTFVVFPYLRQSKKAPEATATEVGNALVEKFGTICKGYNVVKGFLNIELQPALFASQIEEMKKVKNYGFEEVTNDSPLYMVEYSSPNTNKPLHLGISEIICLVIASQRYWRPMASGW